VFRFDRAHAGQLGEVAAIPVLPVALEELALTEWTEADWSRRSITAGPFGLASTEPGRVTLERNPRWWRTPGAYLEQVTFVPREPGGSTRDSIVSGGADVVVEPPSRLPDGLPPRSEVRHLGQPTRNYTILAWNALQPGAYAADRKARCGDRETCTDDVDDILRLQQASPHPVLSDWRVRKALTRAIDREAVVSDVLGGAGVVGSSPVPTTAWGHSKHMLLPLDAKLGRMILDSAGWVVDGNGTREREGAALELTALVDADHRVHRAAIERVAADLARIGVAFGIEALSRDELDARIAAGNFDAAILDRTASGRIDSPPPLHTRDATNGGDNVGAWSSPESDLLLERIEEARTPEEARELLVLWQGYFRDAQPWTILYEERRIVGASARVRDIPSRLAPLTSLHRWWVTGP
jgi:ABC-type transport system substrate-binding protein